MVKNQSFKQDKLMYRLVLNVSQNIEIKEYKKANTLRAKRRKFKHINNLENSYKSSYLRILKCLEKQSLLCSYCFVNTSDCISSIQNLIQFFEIVKRSLFLVWLSKGVSLLCDWA